MEGNVSKRPRTAKKSKNGCTRCKRRKLKCDEAVPSCQRCVRSGVDCPGYVQPFRWSTKYERSTPLSSDSGEYWGNLEGWFEQEAQNMSHVISHPSPLGQGMAGHPDTQSRYLHARDSAAVLTPPLPLHGTYPEWSDENQAGSDVVTTKPFPLCLDLPEDIRILAACQDPAPDYEIEDSTADLPSTINPGPILSLYVPVEQSSLLLDHYFSLVCPISSSFDSVQNPFRSDVSKMMTRSRILFSCVMSMSAAHLYRNEDNSTVPLSFQTEAISEISNELAKINPSTSIGPDPKWGEIVPSSACFVTDEVLLGIILLGMTSSWHDPSSLGLCHLHGSRQLFQSWMATNGFKSPRKTLSMTRSQNFLVSSMVYWEVMVSFLIDQETETLSYLDPFCDPTLLSFEHVCPWTGVGTPIFIRLAKVGTLTRKKRRLHNIGLLEEGDSCGTTSYKHLLEEAGVLERDILRSRLPSITLINDTGDLRAPPAHIHKLARCYRLAGLLELYRAFPELAETRMDLDPAGGVSCDELNKQSQLVLGLAFDILETLESIPNDSRTTATQTLVFLIAGAALGRAKAADQRGQTLAYGTLNQVITGWRHFVRQRLSKTYASIGLRTIQRVVTLLSEVWSCMDAETASGNNRSGEKGVLLGQVHWIDIMAEKNLETILG